MQRDEQGAGVPKQRLVALGVNDVTLLDAVIEHYRGLLDTAAGLRRGAWGLGFFGSGELLVRKCPILRDFDGLRFLRGLTARHLLVVGDEAAASPFRPDAAQPMRFRDWLFAMSGGLGLGESFKDAVEESLDGFVAKAVRTGTRHEAVMVVLMEALYRANTMDVRSFTRELLHGALADGVSRAAELAGGRQALDVAMVLHSGSRLFALSAGRPLWLVRGPEVAPDARGGGLARHRHLKVALVTDRDPGGAEPLPPWTGVEIADTCEPIPFAL